MGRVGKSVVNKKETFVHKYQVLIPSTPSLGRRFDPHTVFPTKGSEREKAYPVPPNFWLYHYKDSSTAPRSTCLEKVIFVPNARPPVS